MASRGIRVQFQIETNPAKRATVELERQVTDSTGRMDRDMRKVGAATTGIGDAARRSAQVAAVGMRAMSAAIGATTAAAAAGERQWLALGTVILSSFAAGGPVVGGIALVAAGIGYLVSQTSESEEAAKRARAAHESWLKAVEERGKAAVSVLQKLGIERLAQAGGMAPGIRRRRPGAPLAHRSGAPRPAPGAVPKRPQLDRVPSRRVRTA